MSIGFWHIVLFSHPSSYPPDLSTGFANFLPSLFIIYALWRLSMRFVMPAFERLPLEFSVYYVGPFWVGVLANVTLDAIPFSRLYAPDLHERPGGITALVIIVIVVFILVVNQVRVFRKTGWLPYYVGWYIAGGLVTLVLALLPGLNLRLHHYFIAIVLMPVTAIPTRLSAVYQGFLLGLFLEGAASYGLDSILQTAAEVSVAVLSDRYGELMVMISLQLREDATLGSDLPTLLTNASNFNASIPWTEQIISWSSVPSDNWDGFSLLVDDVERYVGSALNYSLVAFNATLPHFFRLAVRDQSFFFSCSMGNSFV